MIRKVFVVANPVAGRPGEAILNVLAGVFRRAGVRWDLAVTHEMGDGTRLARRALEDGPDAIAVYGGDGTVREVAAALRGTQVPIAILPGGTGNVFSVAMGIPRAIRRAAELIVGQHRIRQVDVGMAGDEPFLVAAATGLIADVMEGADRDLKSQLGYSAYLLAGFRELTAVQPAAYRLDLPTQTVKEVGVACLVSNTGGVGISGVSMPRDGSNADGLLDVILFQGVDPQSVLSIAAHIVGLEGVAPPLPHWSVQCVRVEADPPQLITCDGDIVGRTPVDIWIEPCALRVIVPEGPASALAAGKHTPQQPASKER